MVENQKLNLQISVKPVGSDCTLDASDPYYSRYLLQGLKHDARTQLLELIIEPRERTYYWGQPLHTAVTRTRGVGSEHWAACKELVPDYNRRKIAQGPPSTPSSTTLTSWKWVVGWTIEGGWTCRY